MSLAEQLIRWRRELHQYPELSLREVGDHRAYSRLATKRRHQPVAI